MYWKINGECQADRHKKSIPDKVSKAQHHEISLQFEGNFEALLGLRGDIGDG